jgi:hypothetical protein
VLDARKDLYRLLLENADVAALVAARVYPDLAPKTAAMPQVTFSLEDVNPSPTHDRVGRPAADQYAYAVRCHSGSSDQAATLAERVRVALDGKRSANSMRFVFQGGDSSAAFRSDDSDEIVYTLTLNFLIFRQGA